MHGCLPRSVEIRRGGGGPKERPQRENRVLGVRRCPGDLEELAEGVGVDFGEANEHPV